MSQEARPTPSINEEKHFNERNSQIGIEQRKLSKGSTLRYSTVKRLSDNIGFMRKKNHSFNIKFGLNKEIA